MIKISLMVLSFILSTCLVADEIESPYEMNFHEAPEWLPTSVLCTNTPGSDSSIAISVRTNHYIISDWRMTDDSWHNPLSTEVWTGRYPTWDGLKWGGDIIVRNSSYVHVVGDIDENNDEWTQRVEAFGYAQLRFDPYDTESWWMYFERVVSNDVIVVTNIVQKRIDEDGMSSFYHTLDGWYEREYFTGLGRNEPDHDLVTTPLQTVGTNRVIWTRRLIGKTNLWTVADRLVDISDNSWTAGFTVPDSPYTNNVTPYWSSRAFDDIYGTQLPEDIQWNSYGLYSLSNKCAVLRGLMHGEVWGGEGTNGWLYTEMFPDDFIFGLTNIYDRPVAPDGHAFDFTVLCSTNFKAQVVDSVTNRTRRLELMTQAAVNQAEAEMNRTILPSSAISAGIGDVIKYVRVREFSTDCMTFGQAGFHTNGDWWGTDSDIYFSLNEITNYWIVTTNGWATDKKNSDAIELSGNDVNIEETFYVDAGFWHIPASYILQSLNERGILGVTGTTYTVVVKDIIDFTTEIRVRLDSTIDCTFDERTFPSPPTNGSLMVTVKVSNDYDVSRAGMPDFANVKTMPMDQSWKTGSHGRVKSAKDICTSAVYSDDHVSEPNVNFHCAVHSFGRNSPVYNIHTNEWDQHRIMMMNKIQEAREYQWTNPRQYVEFSRMNVIDVLNSVRILSGYYYLTWGPWTGDPLRLRVTVDGKWYLENGSPTSLIISPYLEEFITDIDKSAHTINERIPIDERCRTRITNFIDWKWNAIRFKE